VNTMEHPLLTDEPGWGPNPPPPAVATDMGRTSASVTIGRRSYHPRQVCAAALVAAGVIAVLVGWFGVSGSADVWEQVPYLVSGGIGGAVLVALGIVTYLSYEHQLDRDYVTWLVREQRELELGLGAEFDALTARIEQLAGATADGVRAPRTRRPRT